MGQWLRHLLRPDLRSRGVMSQLTTEYAPSDVRAEAPTIARIAGMTGLFSLTVGVVSVIAAQWGRGIAGEGFGYLLTAFGVVGLFIHAARDNDLEVRRLYGAVAAALLIAAVVIGVFPHKPAGGGTREVGTWLPYGVGLGLLSLLFFVPFVRHETEERYRSAALHVLLAVGALLTAGSVIAGIVVPEFLVGPGVMLAFLGLGFVAAYLANVDTAEGMGFKVAVGLGVLGAAALLVAVGRSVVPTVLYEGPAALKSPLQTYDKWKVAARIVSILIGLGIASLALGKRTPLWLRGVAAILGLAIAAVFAVGSFAAPVHTAPTLYLVPFGLILGGIGLAFLAVAVAVVSENTFVVLTRRELAAYFYSPIAYIVLLGMALATAIGYLLFLGVMDRQGTLFEPILQDYYAGSLIGPLMIPFLVPALTMRLLSEEKRTGTLEVLMTAPVSEAVVVLSKFLACWLFFMLCWVPMGLYLIGLRVEGGQAFDYRPLLSFYLAVGASGAAFVAIGLFFSSLTHNQIVAAVLTFVVMLVLMVVQWTEVFPVVGPAVKAALKRLAYWDLWATALRGQLSVRDVLIQLSIAVFGLFLTVKVLEARKWS
jgi:hypothetical protein